MEGLSLDQAISHLHELSQTSTEARRSRFTLEAYTLLETYCHYWPSKKTAALSTLLERFESIKSEEKDRFLKQRRLALRELLKSNSN